ncbi:MAG: serine/threonine-protein phosphatase [Candidatus Eremiobacteraeota bacterium]|nr:serine/threonine-protein phosphatase [Candidatus Eremiobacteraeota bacterium]
MSEPVGTTGGDFYGVNSRSTACQLVVGDVCGKGSNAARLVPSVCAHFAEPAEMQPCERLTRCNDSLSGHFAYDSFCTAWCGDFRSDGTVVYASAGHEPALLQSRGGQVSRLPFGGMPIGVCADIGAEEHTVTMRQGESLLIHTDGLSECFDRGWLTPLDVFDHFDAVKGFLRGCPRRDDVLAVLVERLRGAF